MYVCDYNEERALGVWVFHGPTSAEEWDKHFRDLQRLTSWHGRVRHRPAVAMVLLEGAGRPDALTRQKLATLTALPTYNPYLAIVSASTLVRGVLTALRWLQKSSFYEVEVFADTVEAIKHLETRRGQPLAELGPMLKRAQATASGGPAGRLAL